MAKGRAVSIELDDSERQALTALVRKHGAPQFALNPATMAPLAATARSLRRVSSKGRPNRHVPATPSLLRTKYFPTTNTVQLLFQQKNVQPV